MAVFLYWWGWGERPLPPLNILFSLDILCDKSVVCVFLNVSSGTGWVIMQAASFLCITTPQFSLFLLETKQMENNDW